MGELKELRPLSEIPETQSTFGHAIITDGSGNLYRLDTSKFLQIVAKPISPTDPSPTDIGWYKPAITSEDNKDIDPIDWGTLYTNAGNKRAKEGYETFFFFSGTTWEKTENKQWTETNLNLIDTGKISIGYVGSTGTVNNSDTDYRKIRIDLKPNTTYIFICLSSFYQPSLSKNLVFFDGTGTFISRLAITERIFQFTTPPGTVYSYSNIYVAADGDDLTQIDNYNLSLYPGDYKKSTVNLTGYSNLKTIISNNDLIAGDEMTVVSNGTTFRTTALSENKISENVIVDGYDFAKIDLANDKILATDTLSCIARNSGGVWGFVEDADHTKKGIVSITNNTNSFVINYAKNYSKILALTVVTDETYAKNGISVGSSVGNGYSQVFFYGNRVDGVIGNNLTVENAGYLSGLSAVSQSSGTVTVTHAEIADSIPVITLNQPYNVKIISFDNTSFVFELYNSGTKITDFSNVKVNFVRTGSRSLTNTEMAIVGSNFWIQALMEQQISL
ncbi:hypothetical protein V2E39_21045 [Chryseobacterium arthrosphaerae]|uniref:Uncharacterized protein n=1 Tax=Chryseobacterium arthrosphaerae TaxID=651561 RepID=A0ABU7R578_9FLAO